MKKKTTPMVLSIHKTIVLKWKELSDKSPFRPSSEDLAADFLTFKEVVKKGKKKK